MREKLDNWYKDYWQATQKEIEEIDMDGLLAF